MVADKRYDRTDVFLDHFGEETGDAIRLKDLTDSRATRQLYNANIDKLKLDLTQLNELVTSEAEELSFLGSEGKRKSF